MSPCLICVTLHKIPLARAYYLEVGRVHKQGRQVARHVAGALLPFHAVAVKDAEQRVGAAREALVNHPRVLQMLSACHLGLLKYIPQLVLHLIAAKRGGPSRCVKQS